MIDVLSLFGRIGIEDKKQFAGSLSNTGRLW